MNNKKTVGIMSMQRIENYGSFLQSYSLKNILESFGLDVIFVDYIIEPCLMKEKKPVVKQYSLLFRILRKFYFLFRRCFRIITGKKKKQDKIDAMRLRNKYNDYLKALGVTDERKENAYVDTLIIGSDEVFNCTQTNPAVGYSKQLFGENVNASKVISYAASAGHTTIQSLKECGIDEEVSNMMKTNFASISVRDENTYDLVYKLTDIKPIMNLDPVLIGDFSNVIIENNDLENYVVVYSYENRMSNNMEEMKAIQNFAHSRGLITVSIGNFQTWTDKKIEASPFELLGYIKKADYIITDTFHGTIFSIILEKKFATIIRDTNKQKLTALLEQFNLSDRQIKDLNQINEIITKELDFEFARIIREDGKEKAEEYLKKYLFSN